MYPLFLPKNFIKYNLSVNIGFQFFNKIKITNNIGEVETSSAKKCRTSCLNDTVCIGFSIQKRSKQCLLFDENIGTSQIRTAPKWVTYSKIKIIDCSCPCEVNLKFSFRINLLQI